MKRTLAIALCAFLVACGGGECDKSCDDINAQAHGLKTIEPVACTASGVCS